MGHPHAYPSSSASNDWPNFFRLVSISGLATIASMGNIFTISAIIIDDLLRKKGNSFLVSVTLADLLITSFVLPATSVAILAQIENSENLCHFQYGMVTMSCSTAAIFTSVVGIENYLRLRKRRRLEQERARQQVVVQSGTLGGMPPMIPPPDTPSLCSQFQVTLLNTLLWLVSGLLILLHYICMPQLMSSICGNPVTGPHPPDRETDELLLNSIIVYGATLFVFISLGGMGFLKCICIMRSWNKPMPYVTAREFALIKSNFWNWLVRCLIWCSSIVATVVTHMEQQTSNSYHQSIQHHKFSTTSPYTLIRPYNPQTYNSVYTPSSTSASISLHHSTNSSIILPTSPSESVNDDEFQSALQRLLIWPALLPSCLSSLIYALANKDFRNSYINLFNYCCCKTSVALTRRPRDNLHAGSDVRVHIIPGYNIYSSSTGHCSEVAATPPRFSTFKCGPLMSSYRRDVYEL